MKTFSFPCSCGMKGCGTVITLETDEENPSNVLFSIKDDKHDLVTWVSIDRDTASGIVKVFKSKFKGL